MIRQLAQLLIDQRRKSQDHRLRTLDQQTIPRLPSPRGLPRDFWAKITASAADGTNRWKYSFVEVYKSDLGYGYWSTLTGGRSGTANARNSVEDMNDATGVQGNGVDVANLLGSFAIQPCPANCPVRMREVRVGATVEYWFSYANGVDGECD